MTFNLIIVDDEEVIRNGLSSIVDWNALGFKVVAKFPNGKEAIEYVKTNKVDIVLSDIIMPFVSGLELSKYIKENKPATKVVLLSGYKEFELAKQAIQYNVESYILKPTDVDEVMKIFGELYEKLVFQKNKEENAMLERRKINELLPLLEEQFFTDLIMGGINSREEMLGKIRLFGLDIDVENTGAYFISLKIFDYDNYLQKIWKYGKLNLNTAVRNFFKNESEPFKYIFLGCKQSYVQLLAIVEKSNEIKDGIKNIKEYLNKVIAGMEALIKMKVEIDSIEEYNCITDILARKTRSNQHKSEYVIENDTIVIEEQKKLLEEKSIIKKAKKYINENSHNDIALEDVADEVYLNSVYFSRLFKQQTGENFSDYLIKVRMLKAMKLLKDPRYKVYEIVEKIGYKSIKHFYKIFKKHTGKTPLEYREYINAISEEKG